MNWGAKPFLSFSRDLETPPHLEPEVDALVRKNGPLAVGLQAPPVSAQICPPPTLPRRWSPAVQAGHGVEPCRSFSWASVLHANYGRHCAGGGTGSKELGKQR